MASKEKKSIKKLDAFNIESWISILFIILIVVLINIFFVFVPLTCDMTENNIYTLSDYSKELVNQLDDPLTIQVYISESDMLPPAFTTMPQYLRDLLSDYQKNSEYFQFEIKEVDLTDEALMEEVRTYGLEPRNQLYGQEGGPGTLVEFYLGLVMLYREKKEIIPFIDNPYQLEYQISNNIRKMTRESNVPEMLNQVPGKLYINLYYQFGRQDDVSPQNMQTISNLIEEYNQQTNGKIMLEKIHLADYPESSPQELLPQGISPRLSISRNALVGLQLFVQSQEQFDQLLKEKTSVLGLEIMYEDNKEVLDFMAISMNNSSGSVVPIEKEALDKQLFIPVIRRISGIDPQKVIGFLKGHGEVDYFQQMNILSRELSDQYELRSIDMSTEVIIPQDVDILVVPNPMNMISDWDKYVIDQFVMRGGKLALFIDKFTFSQNFVMGNIVFTNIESLLSNYGVSIEMNLVGVGATQNLVPVPTGRGQISYWDTLFTTSNYNPEHHINYGVPFNLGLMFASPLDITDAQENELIDTTVLFSSPSPSRAVVAQQNQLFQPPVEDINPEDYTEGEKTLAVLLEGTFDSLYTEANIPQPPEGKEIPAGFAHRSTSEETSIFICGDGDFFPADQTVQLLYQINNGRLGNINFFYNLINYMAGDEGMIDIRRFRQVIPPQIETGVEEETKFTIQAFNIVIIPLLVLITGIAIWIMRKSRFNKDKTTEE